MKGLYIVTIYRGSNCGAQLQAHGLRAALIQVSGREPVFLETGIGSVADGFVDSYLKKQLRRSVRHFDLARIPFAMRSDKAFRAATARLKSSPMVGSYDDDDAIVFGSDEIWNVNRKTIRSVPALWGEGIEGGKKIAYAPSANGASLTSSSVADGMRQSLSSFAALSARDAWTAQEAAALTGRDVAVVCDPSLLLDADGWRPYAQPAPQNLGRYALVYSYGTSMTDADIASIRDEAHRRGLKLVSAGFRLRWCDESIPCGPFEFLGLFEGAEYVVTDTFHGTVFSTIWRKPFASFVRKNAKVGAYLSTVGLTERDASSKPLEALLEEPVAWAPFEDKINALRTASLSYLEEALHE